MRTAVLIAPFLIGMAVLWLATCFFTVRQSVIGVRLTFLAGLLAWPMLSFVLAAVMFEFVLTGNEEKPGLASLILMLVAAGIALAAWLIGSWAARIVGWSIKRNRTASS
jgi:hypothetical protein